MSVSNDANAIAHHPADCRYISCKPLSKPATITNNNRCNVISITAAIKPLQLVNSTKLIEGKFNYPMIECS